VADNDKGFDSVVKQLKYMFSEETRTGMKPLECFRHLREHALKAKPAASSAAAAAPPAPTVPAAPQGEYVCACWCVGVCVCKF
jgi:hypothetical protein